VAKKYHTDLPEELSKEFDKIIETYYLNDAEAVRDAIRKMVFDCKRFWGKNQIEDLEFKGKNGGA